MEKSGNQFESLPVRSTATNLKLCSELTKLPTVGHYTDVQLIIYVS